MAEHTPGPWKVSHYAATYDIITDNIYGHHAVAEIDEDSPNAEANACFIVTAPDMKKALEETVSYHNRVREIFPGLVLDPEWMAIMERSIVALAKAKGEV